MKKYVKHISLPITATMILSGCIATGGGSFEPEEVRSADFEAAYENKLGTKYVTEANGEPLKTPDPTDLTELGWDLSTPYGPADDSTYDPDFNPVTPKLKHIALASARTALSNALYNWQQFQADFQVSDERTTHLENIKLHGSGSSATLGTGTWQYKDWILKTSTYPLSGSNIITFYKKDYSQKTIYFKIADYDQKVKAGFVEILDKDPGLSLPREQTYRNLFYRIADRTNDMPTGGTASYTGSWEYATITPTSYSGTRVNSGDQAGGAIIANTATFTANFSEKTLTGSLSATDKNRKKIAYNLTAHITMNGFTGTATQDDSTTLLVDQLSKTANVTGAFAGSKASHLAGRLWSDDNTVAGVFAAKRTGDGEGLSTDGDLFNSYALRFASNSTNENPSDGTSGNTLFESSTTEAQNFSGNINTFQIDNVLITLNDANKVCCDSLQFLRFGTETHERSLPNSSGTIQTDQQGSLFVQGYRTAHSDMPTEGTVQYKGHWTGFGKGTAAVSIRQADADFTANFTDRTISGSLKNTGGSDAVKFDNLTITNSGFTGSATLSVSDGNTTGNGTAISGTGTVQGYFYGNQANELGGTVTTDNKNFGAVFGAKQIQGQ